MILSDPLFATNTNLCSFSPSYQLSPSRAPPHSSLSFSLLRQNTRSSSFVFGQQQHSFHRHPVEHQRRSLLTNRSDTEISSLVICMFDWVKTLFLTQLSPRLQAWYVSRTLARLCGVLSATSKQIQIMLFSIKSFFYLTSLKHPHTHNRFELPEISFHSSVQPVTYH